MNVLRPRIASFLFAVAFATAAGATTTIDFTLDDLIRFSHACVRIRVRPDAVAAATARPTFVIVRSEWDHVGRAVADVEEVIFGDLPPRPFRIVLPGELDGTPELDVDRTYVVFLNFDNRIEPVIGGRWATYSVDEHDAMFLDGRPLIMNSVATMSPGVSSYRLRASNMALRGTTYDELRRAIWAARASLLARGFVAPQRKSR